MSTAFHCQNCGSVTDVSSMLRAFEENPHCPTCGLSASESDAKIQDDLANMMARNLHLGTMQAPIHNVSNPPTPQVAAQPAPITYISQHYHHSAHIVPSTTDEASASASNILKQAGVDPSVLLPSQIQLFKNADEDQKRRLVELWTIAPPTYGNQLPAKDMGNWPQTSMEKEEEAAQERWHRIEQEKWKNLSVLPTDHGRLNAEPYMREGYSQQDHRTATDPVYRSREWWHLNDEEPMEHQYGMLQQLQMQYGSCEYGGNHDAMMS